MQNKSIEQEASAKAVTVKATRLLMRSFTRNGVVMCSAIDTSEGNLTLWGQLVLAELVEHRPKSPLGHPFSFGITKSGEDFIRSRHAAQPINPFPARSKRL